MTDETGEIQEIFEYDANGNMESRQIIDGTDVTVEQYIYMMLPTASLKPKKTVWIFRMNIMLTDSERAKQ